MKIEFDTANLSALDMKVLAVLATGQPPTRFIAEQADPVELRQPDEKVQASNVEPEPEVSAPATATPAATMSDAVAAATQLVSSGQAAKVKEALKAVGAKRVSEIAAGDISAFLAALS